MKWQLSWTDKALAQLAKLDNQVAERIRRYMRRVVTLESPFANAERMKGRDEDHWRWRIGNYRVVALVDGSAMTIIALKVGHRSEVYK